MPATRAHTASTPKPISTAFNTVLLPVTGRLLGVVLDFTAVGPATIAVVVNGTTGLVLVAVLFTGTQLAPSCTV